jgi:TPR repeat protein
MIPRQVSSKTQINLREVSQLTTEVKQLYDAGNHKAALSLLLKLTNARNMPLPLLAVLHSLIIEFAPQNLPYLSIEEIAAHYRLVEQYPNTTINPEKTLWLGDQFLLAEKLEPALEFYAKIKVHHSLPLQITALYNIGLTYTKKGDMNKEALAKFEACVVIFRKNKKMLTKTKLPVARAAHCAAVIFDDADSNLSNPEKALKYYQIAAGFDLSESLHNLGYKYENGEDVEINYDLAEHYYRRAANQDYSNSVLNLANMLYGLNKHIDDLLVRLEKIEDDARVYHTLGVIYFERYNANKEAKKFAKKAHRNLLKASKLGHAGSTKNLGIMHYLGMEIPVNLTEAEKCFKFATENGIDAYDCLAVVYQAKLAQEDDELNQQTIILYTLDALKKAGHHLNDIDTQSHDEKLATLLELKLLLNVQSFGINQNIVETAKNNSLAKIKRIELILEHEIVTLDTLNLVTAIQRIGRLTAASPGARDFHQQQFPKILLYK